MKSQDVLVILKLFLYYHYKNKWTIREIAKSLNLSISETHSAIKRCKESGLYDDGLKRPVISAIEEFFIHGLKYIFPVTPGTFDRGIPTAHSAYPLSQFFATEENDVYIWPYENGQYRGLCITPLYHTVPTIVENDIEMYALLSLLDGIRIGRVREKKIAIDELVKRLRGNKNIYEQI